jgi:hypothetical protein
MFYEVSISKVILLIILTTSSQKLTGIIMSSIVWDEVLKNVFPATVSGIDCVLETENQVYTYRVTKGVIDIV